MPINIALNTNWQTRQVLRNIGKELKDNTVSQKKRQEAAAGADNLLRHTIFPELIRAIGEDEDSIPAPLLIPSQSNFQFSLRIKPDYGHGSSFLVNVKKKDTVKHLKELVEVETEVVPEGQRLFFLGAEMKDGWEQLEQYYIGQDGDVVVMKMRPDPL